MPRLSHPKITKAHAASFLVELYLQDPQFYRELCDIRRHYSELLAKLVFKEVEFLANCKKAFTTEEYHKIIPTSINRLQHKTAVLSFLRT